MDLPSFSRELRQIFNDDSIKVVPRESPLKHPISSKKDTEPWPAHNQIGSLISCVFNIMPVTKDIKNLYAPTDAQRLPVN